MADSSNRTLQLLVGTTLVLAFCVVVLGAYTRLVDAGLGCPDWPGCYGHLTVPDTEEERQRAEELYPDFPIDEAKAWTEMVHRYLATLLGIMVIAIVAVAWFKRQSLRFPLVLLALVVLQGVFGAWTVTLQLWPQVVTAHLLGGFATLALLWWYLLKLDPFPLPQVAFKFAQPYTCASCACRASGRPRWMDEFELCSAGLSRLSALPWRAVSGYGFRVWFQCDAGHWTQLSRRRIVERSSHCNTDNTSLGCICRHGRRNRAAVSLGTRIPSSVGNGSRGSVWSRHCQCPTFAASIRRGLSQRGCSLASACTLDDYVRFASSTGSPGGHQSGTIEESTKVE